MLKALFLYMLVFLSITLEAHQVILITGASRGIGETTATLLASKGYEVYAGVRNPPNDSRKNSLPNLHIIQLDVTDQLSVDAAVSTILEKEGHIDVLVNNAGIMVYGSLENVTIEEAEKLFDVNFFGIMRMSQAVLPVMRANNSGKIIQISSRSGFRPLPSISIYAASKFALEGLSETMAALLKPWNISVSLIEPGPVNTELDYLSPYGTRLNSHEDPYLPIFEKSGLLDPYSPIAQEPSEIASIVLEIIESSQPHLRYQTTDAIKKQAAKRFVDITGDANVEEWSAVLFPPQEK